MKAPGLVVGACSLLAACSSSTPDAVVLKANAGLDGAVFSGDPAIARVSLRVRTQDGKETEVATADASSGSIDVPDSVQSSGTIGALALVGLDGSGAILAYGRTPDLDLGGIDQTSVPISIFVERVGAVQRMVRLPSAKVARPIVVSFGPRFVLVADSSSGSLARVDLLNTSAAAEDIGFSSAPTLLATSGDVLLSIDARGGAAVLHPGDSAPTTLGQPDGASFSDVAGGAVIEGDDGAAYIVGATRGAASDVVLKLTSDGTIVAHHLHAARANASAAWATGRGLVVMGGASSDGVAKSPEILASGATDAVTLPFPADASTGALLASTSDGKLVRVSSDGAIDTFDLSCASACTPTLAAVKIDGDARADDALVARDRGGFVVVRSGALSTIDAQLAVVTQLADVAGSLTALSLPTGVVAVFASGDDVVRAVY